MVCIKYSVDERAAVKLTLPATQLSFPAPPFKHFRHALLKYSEAVRSIVGIKHSVIVFQYEGWRMDIWQISFAHSADFIRWCSHENTSSKLRRCRVAGRKRVFDEPSYVRQSHSFSGRMEPCIVLFSLMMYWLARRLPDWADGIVRRGGSRARAVALFRTGCFRVRCHDSARAWNPLAWVCCVVSGPHVAKGARAESVEIPRRIRTVFDARQRSETA